MNKSLLFTVALLSVAGASAQQRVSDQVKQVVPFTAPAHNLLSEPLAVEVAQVATAQDVKDANIAKATANVVASYRRPAGCFWHTMTQAGSGYYFPLWVTHPFVETTFVNTTAASADPTYNWAVQLYDRSSKSYQWYSSSAKDVVISQIRGEMDTVPTLTAKVGDVSDTYSVYGYKWTSGSITATYPAYILSNSSTYGYFTSLTSPLLVTSHYAGASTTSSYSWTYYTGAKDVDGTTGKWFGRNGSGYNLLGAGFEKPEHPYVLNKVYAKVSLLKVKSGKTATLTAKVYKLDELKQYDTTAVKYTTDEIAKLEENLIATGTCTVDENTSENTVLEFPLSTEIEGIPMEVTPEIDSPILVCITGYNDENISDITFTITSDKTNEGHGEVCYIGAAEGSVPTKIYGLHNFFKSGADMYNGMSILLDIETPFIVYNYSTETGETTFPAAGGSKSVEIYSQKVSEDWNLTLEDGSDLPDWLEVSLADGEGENEGLVTATFKAAAYPSTQTGGRRADVKLGFPGAHLTYIVRQNDQSGVADVVVEGVQAYIANGNIYVNVKGGEKAGELNVYSVAGQLVKTAQLSQGTNIIPAEDLAKGAYLLQYNGKTVKVVK